MISAAFLQDVNSIISHSYIPWHKMKDSTVLVTGATGVVGKVLIHALCAAREKYGLNSYIIGSGRNLEKGNALINDCKMDLFIDGDITAPFPVSHLTKRIDYVIHCAAITKSAQMVSKPIDVINTSVLGTQTILNVAKEHNCKSFLFVSSMEVYGATKLAEVTERDLGYVDLLSPRSCYPESKRLCENLCVAYLVQCGMPVKIARLARTFGAGTPNDLSDTRVAMQFARSGLLGQNIELHTEGNAVSNYCYTADAAAGLIAIMLAGENGEAYNVSGANGGVTVRQEAELVARDVFQGKISVVFNIPENPNQHGYGIPIGFTLNTCKLQALGWRPQYTLLDAYRRMLLDWGNDVR